MDIPEPLKGAIQFGFQLEMLGSHFTRNLQTFLQLKEGYAKAFRQQLAHAILHDSITPAQYRELTGDSRWTTPDSLQYWLREVWMRLYEDAPVSEEP